MHVCSMHVDEQETKMSPSSADHKSCTGMLRTSEALHYRKLLLLCLTLCPNSKDVAGAQQQQKLGKRGNHGLLSPGTCC